ncbi:MAG TPA: fused MFS/spermidine synthase [Chthoniobacterales bacterium]|nr:fused MFS/spermidine synthase [Chthoniobacterales bacterium]
MVFFASGFAALLYQVIWQRLLVFFSGTDVYSVTLIVTTFMAGLGIGNLAGGYVADRLSRRLNLAMFVVAELAIMLFAILSKGFFYDFLYTRHAELGQSNWLLWIVLFCSLLWPTFFMGVSLPLLAKALTRDVGEAAPTIGRLYGINTLGAAIGALVTTWVLLPQLGLEQSLKVGAALNFGCAGALVLLVISMRKQPEASPLTAELRQQEPNPSPPQTAQSTGFTFGTWLLLYVLSGFIGLSLEILWLRLLAVVLKCTAFAFGTMLTIYLGGLGLGAIAGTSFVRKSRRPVSVFLALQTLVAVSAGIAIVLLVSHTAESLIPNLSTYLGVRDPLNVSLALNGILAWWRNQAVPLETSAEIGRFVLFFGVVPLVLILPATTLMGLSFPYLQKAVQRDIDKIGRRVGTLQVANILGCMAGASLTGLTLLNQFGTAVTLKIVVGLASIFAALWLRTVFRTRVGSAAFALGLTAIAWIVLPSAQTLWSRLHGAEPRRVIFSEDGSGVSLMRDDGTESTPYITVFVNGLGYSWIPYGDIHTVLGALPLLIHPDPRDIALVGLGSGDTAFSIGGRPEVQSIRCIEILRPQLRNLRQLVQTHPDPGLVKLLDDKRVQHLSGDGRAYLMRSELRFDIIEADAQWPTTAYAGNVYSREYFELVKSRLKVGGFAVTWVPTERIHQTFLSVFPYVVRCGDNVDIGSSQPIAFDRATLYARAQQQFVHDYFAEAGIDVEAILKDYLQPGKVTAYGPDATRAGPAEINTDLFPRDEFDYRSSWK